MKVIEAAGVVPMQDLVWCILFRLTMAQVCSMYTEQTYTLSVTCEFIWFNYAGTKPVTWVPSIPNYANIAITTTWITSWVTHLQVVLFPTLCWWENNNIILYFDFLGCAWSGQGQLLQYGQWTHVAEFNGMMLFRIKYIWCGTFDCKLSRYYSHISCHFVTRLMSESIKNISSSFFRSILMCIPVLRRTMTFGHAPWHTRLQLRQ